MSTPAGWYDDGSGRQRWWDGQRWTEHFAPATPQQQAPQQQTSPYQAPQYPASPYQAVVPQVPQQQAATPGYTMAPEPPKTLSVLGLISMGVALLGIVLVCLPIVSALGWLCLFAAVVLAIIAFFLKGKKWPAIVGLGLSVVGAIVGVIMLVVFGLAFFATIVDEYEPQSSATTSPYDTDDDGDTDNYDADTAGRPTAAEVAEGLATVVSSSGAAGYTDEHLLCFAEEFVASDMSDETLQEIASGKDTFEDTEVATEFAEEFAAAIPICVS